MNGRASAAALELVGLESVMALSRGSAEVGIGLVDGPVATDHPALADARICALAGSGGCAPTAGRACGHGTFLAGVLVARRDADAPAISPACTLLVRPIFDEPGADATRAPGGSRAPYACRCPVLDEPVGLGDVVKRATSAVGIKPCGGCAQRAARLNSRLAFAGRRPSAHGR